MDVLQSYKELNLRLMSLDLNIQTLLKTKNIVRQQQNQDQVITTDRYHFPKIPQNISICRLYSSNKVENEIHFLFGCNLYKNLRQHFFQDVDAKYSKFVDLKKSEQAVFLSNNIDPSKKLIVYKIKCYDCQSSYIGKTAETLVRD